MNDFREFIKEKCLAFSVQIVELYKVLSNKNEYVLSKQMLRSGTSIGANLVEAQNAVSKADFVAKIYISLKECAETEYWLELLKRTKYITEEEYKTIASECEEIKKILMASVRTATDSKGSDAADKK